MNVFSLNLIWTYYIRHVVIVLWPTSCVTSLSFTNPLLWPHGIVKCPLHVHFRNSPEVIGHPGTFCYCLMNTVDSDILVFSHTVFTRYIVGKYVISFAAIDIWKELFSAHPLPWSTAIYSCFGINVKCFLYIIINIKSIVLYLFSWLSFTMLCGIVLPKPRVLKKRVVTVAVY